MIALFVIAFIFGSQNNQMFTLNYMIAKTDITVAGAVSLFTFIGIIIGLMLALLWKFTRAIKSKSIKTKG